MPTTPDTAPDQTPRRLDRLREIVDRRADPHWGIEEVRAVLALNPTDPATRCPRYAGIVAESGDERVIVDDDADAIAGEMADLATAEIPITPVELIDLDTGQSRPAILETVVRFEGIDAPEPQAGAGLVLLAIHHRHGASHQLARDEPEAQRLLHDWVAEWWETELARRPQLGAMPSDRTAATERYFEVVEEEYAETVTIQLPDEASGPTTAAAAACQWELYLPDEDRNAGWTNHCYVLQLVCRGTGRTPQEAWEDAIARGEVPAAYDAAEPPTVAVRTAHLAPGPDPIEPAQPHDGPDAPASRASDGEHR